MQWKGVLVAAFAVVMAAGAWSGAGATNFALNSQREVEAPPCVPFAWDPGGTKIYRIPTASCDVANHTIAVYEEGRFRPAYGPRRTIPAHEAVDPVIEKLRAQANALPAGKPLKIAFFAHGGLVAHSGAIDSAERISQAMLADGYAPVFLVWNSGLLDAYPDRLCCVRDGEHDENRAPINIVSRLGGDVAASVVRSPQNFGAQALRFNESVVQRSGEKYYLQLYEDWPDNGLCAELRDGICPKIVFPPYLGHATDDEREAELNGRNRSFGREATYVALWPARVLTTIVLPEVGAKGWDNMVRRTRMAFERSSVPPPMGEACVTVPDVPALRKGEEQPPQGGFAVFFDRLSCELVLNSEGKFELKGTGRVVELHFYGHSMGAFIGNEALRLYPDMPWSSLTFMAAASSTREFLVGAAPTIARKDIKFRNLTLHPLNESRELFSGGLAPQGSLLEWIDEMFEGPRSPDERTMGKWTNFKRNANLIPKSVRDRTTIRVFTKAKTPGAECTDPLERATTDEAKRCHPVEHGEFDDYTFWREAYWTGIAVPPPSEPIAPPVSANEH